MSPSSVMCAFMRSSTTVVVPASRTPNAASRLSPHLAADAAVNWPGPVSCTWKPCCCHHMNACACKSRASAPV